MSEAYNPDYSATGIEGGVDTNQLPWLEAKPGTDLTIKPLRASHETGMFSVIVQLPADRPLQHLMFLGAMDLFVLSGQLHIPNGPLAGNLGPGTFGYIPANVRMESLAASETVEMLCNCYGPLAFAEGDAVQSVITAQDITACARQHGLTLIPNTLAECLQPRPEPAGADAAPLAISSAELNELAVDVDAAQQIDHPFFVDTRAVPWIVNPGLPDIALKILRVSEETGVSSLLVRHNGVAGPHYHLGAADFLVLSGHIGYRAGPAEGYGPGVWFFEPAGARHEATQRVGDDVDLIYTANVYGPVQFDEGPGTAITAVQSWMQYKELAAASGARLVRNTLADDSTLLAAT